MAPGLDPDPAASKHEASPQARLIDWTGERCVPWAPDHQVVYEHLHRYHLAAPFCVGKRVLDLASGEGYGSAILGAVASEVVGVDIDNASVEHASLTYGTDHVRFIEGSILDLDLFTDHSFAVVVCFEAVEHVDDHDLLMQVVIGALRPDGLFVISTPDRATYTELHQYNNPFHVHELDREEFRHLLSRHFQHVTVLTQEVAAGSVMQGLDGGHEGELIRVSGTDEWNPQPNGTPSYLVAFASDAPLPPIPSVSTLIDTALLLVRRSPELTQLEDSAAHLASDLGERDVEIARLQNGTIEREAEAARLLRTVAERESALALLQEQASRQDAQIDRLERTVAERESALALLQEQASRQDAQIDRLEGSVRTLADRAAADAAAYAAADAAHAAADAARAAADAARTAADAAAFAQLNWEMDFIKASRGWRALEIMRRPYRQMRRLGRALRHPAPFRRRSP